VTVLAFVLVLAAAFGHASWNLLAKKAGGGARFIWLYSTVSAVIYAPIALTVGFTRGRHFGTLELTFVLGSALIHTGYFLLLQQGYQRGDLSLIYPLARASGSFLSTTTAILVFGEHPSRLALGGAALIGAGILLLARRTTGSSQPNVALFGLLTGTLIALYTLWDKHAVSKIGISPFVMEWGSTLGRTILLSPAASTDWLQVRDKWKSHRQHALGIGFLCPLSYILVLTAMVFSPVSYIAPAREISILIGTAMGARLLAEQNPRRRLGAATMMVLGFTALAIG
jgi:drug/metabolite transporter (DMT)-like permease